MSELFDEGAYLTLEPVDLGCQRTAAIDELTCYPRYCSLDLRETLGESIEVAKMVQRPESWLVARVEFVQMPAQPADHAGPLANQVFTVVDQQPHFTLGPVQLGDRQVGLAQGCAGDGECVDRVALAERAGRATRVRHQLRRDPHDPLAGGEQVSLQTAREVPAVLDRPAPIGERSRPSNELEMISRRRADRPRRELTPLLVDRDDGVAALVCVDPDSHYARCLLHSMGEKHRTGRRAYPSRGETTLLSSHVGRSVIVSRAAQRTEATKAHNAVERDRKTGSD